MGTRPLGVGAVDFDDALPPVAGISVRQLYPRQGQVELITAKDEGPQIKQESHDVRSADKAWVRGI
jgi:hypothetical protein